MSLATGLATISEMEKQNTIEYCWKLGKRLMDGLKAVGIKTAGYPCRPMIVLDYSPSFRSLLLQEFFKRGILIHNSMALNLCYSHSEEDIDYTLNAIETTLSDIKTDKAKFEGTRLIQPAFRRL